MRTSNERATDGETVLPATGRELGATDAETIERTRRLIDWIRASAHAHGITVEEFLAHPTGTDPRCLPLATQKRLSELGRLAFGRVQAEEAAEAKGLTIVEGGGSLDSVSDEMLQQAGRMAYSLEELEPAPKQRPEKAPESTQDRMERVKARLAVERAKTGASQEAPEQEVE